MHFYVRTASCDPCYLEGRSRLPRGLKAWLCGRLLPGIMNVVCCQAEVSAMGRSLVQRSSTECGASECDLGTSLMGKPRHTRLGISNHEKYRLVFSGDALCAVM